MHLFLSFEGRITRKRFWLGLLMFVILGLAISLPFSRIAPQLGLTGRLALFVLSLAFIYPLAALLTQRLHDRDRDAFPRLHLFLGAAMLSNLIHSTKLGYRAIETRNFVIEMPGPAAYAVLAACSLVSLAILFELGFRDGTRGPNRFGPDPRQRNVEAS